MAQYCTIQEAFNIPSFESKRQKSKLSPLAMQQCGVQPNASADPYNAYTGEAGKGEQALYMKEQFTTPKSQPSKPVTEGFMCGPTGGIGGACSSRDYPPDASANSAGYVSQGGDYNYYCKAMNVCPKVMPSMEAFTTQAEPSSANPNAPNPNQCAPLQAPLYEIPVSDASKKQYDLAMQTALNSQSSASNMPPKTSSQYPMRSVNMSNITGFYDDEIEQYMRPSQMVAAPMPTVPSPNNASKIQQAPADFKSESEPRAVQNTYNESRQPAPATNKWQYIMDLLLFVIAGVLIILLCEMLFKIAFTIGMKDTFQMLKPYLKELEDIKLKIASEGVAVE